MSAPAVVTVLMGRIEDVDARTIGCIVVVGIAVICLVLFAWGEGPRK